MPPQSKTAHPIKYRSSCDRCQDNKVKCGQEKPECERCVKKRLACVYSPIRTMGRPRKSQSGSGASATAGTNAPPPMVSAQKEVLSTEYDRATATAAAAGTGTAIITSTEERHSPDHMQGIEEDLRRTGPLSYGAGNSEFPIPDPDNNIDPDLQSIITSMHINASPGSSNLNYQTSSSPGAQTSSGGSSTNGDASSTTGITAPSSINSGPSPPTSCYTSILTRSLKLEQALLSAAGDPIGLEAVLEAESDFRALKTQLFSCPGGGSHSHSDTHMQPKHVTAITGTQFILSSHNSSSSSSNPPCLLSLMESRLCLTTLIMYAERVAEVLKDAIADFQPFPGVDSCSTRCSYFGVQNYRVLRAMDFHALRVDGFFLDRGSERVNRLWDLDGVREQLRLATTPGTSNSSSRKGDEGVEVVTVRERAQPRQEEQAAWEVDEERGNGYAGNHNFGSMTPAEGRALRRIFRLRMQKFRAALVDIHRFVKPSPAPSPPQPSSSLEGGAPQEQERDHDHEMVANALGFVEPMVDNLIRRVEVMEQVMAGTLG